MRLLKLVAFINDCGINLCSYEDGSFLVVQVITEGASVLYAVDMTDGDVDCHFFVEGQKVKRPAQAYPKWIKDVIRYRQALYDVTVQRNFTIEGIAS